MIFSFGASAPPARGAGGIPTSPLCPPGPPIPPSNGRGIPPDPPCGAGGTSPCFLTDRSPYRARPLVWSGARNQSGAAAGTPFARYLNRGTYRCKVFLPQQFLAITPGINRRPGAGGGISCAEGDSGPPRDGCKASWARPCEASGALYLSNGGSGGGHETCTLWPPPAPFGYFPARGKYLARPQAGETSHKK